MKKFLLVALFALTAGACVQAAVATTDPPDDVTCEDPVLEPSKWWNWSPNHDQGPFEGPPDFPADDRGTWQGPHTNGGPDGDGTFQTGSPGNANWFHREPAVPNPDYPCEPPPTTVPDDDPPPTTEPPCEPGDTSCEPPPTTVPCDQTDGCPPPTTEPPCQLEDCDPPPICTWTNPCEPIPCFDPRCEPPPPPPTTPPVDPPLTVTPPFTG